MGRKVKSLKYKPTCGTLDITETSIGSGGLVVELASGGVDIHNDEISWNGSVSPDNLSNCLHISSNNLNLITATFQFTTTDNITDNNTWLKFNGDFTLPLAVFLTCYDITTGTPQKVQYYYQIGTNQFSLINSEANHKYVGVLTFSYIM